MTARFASITADDFGPCRTLSSRELHVKCEWHSSIYAKRTYRLNTTSTSAETFVSWDVNNGLDGAGGLCASGNSTLCGPPNDLSLTVIASARRGPAYCLGGGANVCVDSGLRICVAVFEEHASCGRAATLSCDLPVPTGCSIGACGPDCACWRR